MLLLMMAASHGFSQGILFNPSQKHAMIALSDGNRVATCINSAAHRYAAATLPKSSGKWQFEMAVPQMSPSTAGNISIGIMVSGEAPGATYPGFSGGAALWTRQNAAASRLYTGGAESEYTALPATAGNILSEGSRCTITIDFETKEFSVYKDGALIVTQTIPSIDTASNQYVPAIKSWGFSATPTVARISPTIAYPVAGFLPWS